MKQTDTELAAKIVDAMKEVDAATATRNEKAVAAGRLLIEAQKRHPTERAFAEFLELAGGIQIRRARDLIALALGRKDFEQHQIENAAAQQRHRDKLKAEKIEREKAKAALPKPDPKPEPKGKGRPEPKPKPEPALRNAADKTPPPPPDDELLVAALKLVLRHPESRRDTWRKVVADLGKVKLEEIVAILKAVCNEHCQHTVKAKADRAEARHRRP
jgi:hypothetical protein